MTNEAVQQAVLEKLNLLETGLNGVSQSLVKYVKGQKNADN